MVVEAARRSGVATHLLAWRRPITAVQEMVLDGRHRHLREVHNWTDRPFWPQALALPTDRRRFRGFRLEPVAGAGA